MELFRDLAMFEFPRKGPLLVETGDRPIDLTSLEKSLDLAFEYVVRP